MADLSIISWNCMNLGKNLTLDKPVLSDAERCKYIAETIDKLKPDILLIQEAGINGDEIAEEIVQNIATANYKSFSSENIVSVSVSVKGKKSRVERYIVVFNENKLDVKASVFGNININKNLESIGSFRMGSYYRNAWMLYCTNKGSFKTYYLRVVHAPSPSHPLEIRKQAIKNFSEIGTTFLPTILLGDLNFKADELNDLAEAFNSNNCIYMGQNPPLKTSLKFPLTQLKLHVSENEPYDQFWIKDQATPVFKNFTTLVPDYPEPLEENELIERLMNELSTNENKLSNYKVTVAVAPDFSKLFADVLNVLQNSKTLTALTGFSELHMSDDISTFINSINANINKVLYNGKPDEKSESLLKSLLSDLQALNNYLGAKLRDNMQLRGVLYRLAFSDHLPLQLNIDFN